MNKPLINTAVYVNVHRYPSGIVTSAQHNTIDAAQTQQKYIEAGARGGKVIARIRVPIVCVEGQYDV